MAHDDVVFSALAYQRNRGADLEAVRRFVSSREARAGSTAKDERSLARLAAQGTAFQVGERWFLTPAGHKRAKGHALPGEWQDADSWILLALMGRGPCSLEQLISTADYINHAIPTLDEIHGALNRFVAAKLVRVRSEGFVATAKARSLHKKVRRASRRSVRAQQSGLARILECPHCGVALRAVRFRSYVNQAALDAAYKTYRSRR